MLEKVRVSESVVRVLEKDSQLVLYTKFNWPGFVELVTSNYKSVSVSVSALPLAQIFAELHHHTDAVFRLCGDENPACTDEISIARIHRAEKWEWKMDGPWCSEHVQHVRRHGR